MSQENAPGGAPRTRYEPIGLGSAFKSGALMVYAIVGVLMAGVAVYMGAVEHRPLTSAYVAGPAIGAVWFVLRVAMMLGARR